MAEVELVYPAGMEGVSGKLVLVELISQEVGDLVLHSAQDFSSLWDRI